MFGGLLWFFNIYIQFLMVTALSDCGTDRTVNLHYISSHILCLPHDNDNTVLWFRELYWKTSAGKLSNLCMTTELGQSMQKRNSYCGVKWTDTFVFLYRKLDLELNFESHLKINMFSATSSSSRSLDEKEPNYMKLFIKSDLLSL